MTTKLNRPPFILTHPADTAGCGFHRIMRPCMIMGRSGYMNGRAETSFLQDHIIRGINPDVVVVQRQSEDSQVETIKRYRALLPNAFFVFEIDDALSSVPEKSWHAPYMIPNIDAKLSRAANLCDVVTVTTQDLADHMRKVCGPTIPIRIVPNMLGRDDMESCYAIRQQLSPNKGAKLRVGWGGGIGHIGDLELLNDAMVQLKDEVQWVFLGMDPKVPNGVDKHYLGAATPDRYLASLQAMNIDLMVAPLEENHFNRCKSNLRLIEGGACKYATIASPVAPYHTDSPPVFAYADNTDEWVASIRAFAKLSPEARAYHGQQMLNWVNKHYVMDDHLAARIKGWLPDDTEPFVPNLNATSSETVVVRDLESLKRELDGPCDVLYLRPNTALTTEAKSRLESAEGDVLCGLSNDGGPWGFPSTQQFTFVDGQAIDAINLASAEMASANVIDMFCVSGPAVLMRRKTIAAIGHPNLDQFESIEIALLDWSANAKSHGLKVGLVPSVFVGATAPNQPTQLDAENVTVRLQSCWPRAENDEASLRALRESIELIVHKNTYRKIPPQDRSNYDHWRSKFEKRGAKSLALADATHPVTIDITTCQYGDVLDTESDWVFFHPPKSELPIDFLHLCQDAIKSNPLATIFYADHDTLSPKGEYVDPDLKPNFDFHMFLSRDYLTQALLIHRSLLREDGAVYSQADMYSRLLQIIDTGNRPTHVPYVLVSLPPVDVKTQTAIAQNQFKALTDYLTSLKSKDIHIEATAFENHPIWRRIHYSPNATAHGNPSVSIIIPSRDNVEMLAPAVNTILTMTQYPNFEILIVDNGSTRKEFLDFINSIKDRRVKILRDDQPYNWSKINNDAVKHTTSQILLFLNDDTRILAPNWLSEMVGASLIPNVGAVGARLVYPHGLVQHVGVVSDKGMNGHIHKGLPVTSPGLNGYAVTSHEATAVTGACLAVMRDKFIIAGGFREEMAQNFNDVAFCLELRRKGYVNVFAAMAELQHFEGVSRNAKGLDQEAMNRIQEDGATLVRFYPDPDPYWNPNLLITYLQNGRMVAGMDMNAYVYPPMSPPWGQSSPERILCIGPDSPLEAERTDGDAIFNLSIVGNVSQIQHPPMLNSGPWDIRRPDIAKQALEKLGISKVIVTQLGEAPVQALSFARSLGVPVEYRPLNAESVCPRGDLKPNGSMCATGYRKKGTCQTCIDLHSSPHGNVVIASWYAEWLRFLESAEAADLEHIEMPAYREAIKYVYSA